MTTTISIRVLILKHSPESSDMSNADADLALSAIDSAKSKGLDIQSIGNYFCTDPAKLFDGRPCPIFQGPPRKHPRQSSPKNVEFNRILHLHGPEKWARFQDFVSEHMVLNAKTDDTLIIFTIGHGAPSGNLDNLGQRKDVLTALANASQQNSQRVIWWELACYGCAGLPAISSLTPQQQTLFAIVAASQADQEASSGVQGAIMDKVFQALVADDKSIDPDGDGLIRDKELDNFFNTADIPHDAGGPILFAQSQDYLLFGSEGWFV